MSRNIHECVFLVDDDEDDRFLIQQVFKQYSPDCNLKDLGNGEELLDALTQASSLPSLILLDLNMPLMGGLEALERIRKNPIYDAVPVVILTTSDHPQDKQQATALGANSFLIKPVSIEGLNQLVLQLKKDWLMGKCVSC